MIVLGIDPGLATLGWGVIEAERGRQRLINYGCILTTPQQRFPAIVRDHNGRYPICHYVPPVALLLFFYYTIKGIKCQFAGPACI